MVCKYLCVVLAAACAAQVMATPARPLRLADPKGLHLKPLQRGLIADIDVAIDTIYALQDSIDAFKAQIDKSLIVVTVDTALQIRNILKQIQEFGISAEDLAQAEAAIDQSFADVEAVFTGILDDLTVIVDLLGQILSDLVNLHLIDMYQHVQDLSAAFDKLQADASTVASRVTAEFTKITKVLLDLTIGEPVEIVQQITQDLANIGDTWVAQGNKLWDSLVAVNDAAATCLQALWAIVSKDKIKAIVHV